MAKLVRSALKIYFSSRVWNSTYASCRFKYCYLRHVYTAMQTLGTQSLNFHTCNLQYDESKTSVGAEITENISTQIVSDKDLALEILNAASKKDKRAQSIQLHMIQRQIKSLLSVGLTENEIRTVLSSNLNLLREPRLPEFIIFLNEYGFTNSDIVNLLKNYDGSNIVNAQKKIDAMFNTLLSIGQNSNDITSLLTHNPQILSMSTKQVINRLNSLKALFKTQDVFTLVLKSPTVLLGDWDTFHKKFEYVFHAMKITQPQMVKSNVFDHPLSHIKSRHLFLSRSGQWFTGKLRQGDKSPNPRLTEIVDTNDSHFAKKFGDMSAEDYRTFCRLLAKEDVEEEEELEE